jgi:hypothetical protein
MKSRVDVERTTARSAVLRWRLESSVHPMVIFPSMYGKLVDMDMKSRVDVEQTTARSAVLRWRLESSVHPMVIFPFL